jgi:hypothetical protein
VLHLVSQSFKKMPVVEKRRMIERNEGICRQRWGARRSQLLLVRKQDVAAEELIALARGHRVYLVDNRYVPEQVRAFRHQNLHLLHPGPLGDVVCFLWQNIYLARKKRIDEAHILYK